MSMELHVFFRGALPARAAVNAMLRELTFPFSLSGRGTLEGHRGFLPMKLRREETGVEFDVFDDQEMIAQFAGEVDPGFDRSASFRWGGDEDEMLAALCTAAALAKLLGAVVLDEEEDRPFSADRAVEMARRSLDAVQARRDAEKAKGRVPGTRPADIKRYLKPLLALRPDLAVADRALVIRPVRHVLRGAFFDRTGDPYSFSVSRILVPLYDAHFDIFLRDRVRGAGRDVWEQHFQMLLLDQLAEHVFAPAGQVTTLSAVAERLAGTFRSQGGGNALFKAPVRAFILAGAPERAEAYLDDLARGNADRPHMWRAIQELRSELDRDIAELCAEAHAREAEMVAALKLQSVWEPSPFPVEEPKASHARRCDEAPFSIRPWVPTPEGLFADEPAETNTPVFSHDRRVRAGRNMLLLPLTREEAERRHHAREDYQLTVRPMEKGRLTVHYRGKRPKSPHDPKDPDFLPPLSIWLSLDVPGWHVRARLYGDLDRQGWLGDLNVEISPQGSSQEAWCAGLRSRPSAWEITDRREGEPARRTEIPMTEAEMAPYLEATFAFGDYWALLHHVDAFTRMAGYGPLPGLPERPA